MNIRSAWALLLTLPLAGGLPGCGLSQRQNTSLLERDMRHLEDQLYALEDEYRAKCEEVEALKAAAAGTRREDTDDSLPRPRRPLPRPDGVEPPRWPEHPRVPDLAPPQVEPGIPKPPEVELPVPATPARPPMPGDTLPPPRDPSSGRGDPNASAEVDARITHVVINPRLTGGLDIDERRGGDEGLLLVLEPRNADGQYVPLAGDLVVVVLDPSQEGEAARVARWDIESTEAARHLRKTSMGRGIHLELPWPEGSPAHPNLRLYVRYVTTDGRSLETDRDIRVRLSSDASARWTPAVPGTLFGRNGLLPSPHFYNLPPDARYDLPNHEIAPRRPRAEAGRSPPRPTARKRPPPRPSRAEFFPPPSTNRATRAARDRPGARRGGADRVRRHRLRPCKSSAEQDASSSRSGSAGASPSRRATPGGCLRGGFLTILDFP
jgi:hypothetical protein